MYQLLRHWVAYHQTVRNASPRYYHQVIYNKSQQDICYRHRCYRGNGYPYHFHHITTSTASNSLPFTRESISGKFCIPLWLCNEFLYSSNSPNGICRKTWHNLSISSIGSTAPYCWSYLIKYFVSIFAYTLKWNNSLYFFVNLIIFMCYCFARWLPIHCKCAVLCA